MFYLCISYKRKVYIELIKNYITNMVILEQFLTRSKCIFNVNNVLSFKMSIGLLHSLKLHKVIKEMQYVIYGTTVTMSYKKKEGNRTIAFSAGFEHA